MSQVSQSTVRAEEDGWRFDRWAKAHFPTLALRPPAEAVPHRPVPPRRQADRGQRPPGAGPAGARAAAGRRCRRCRPRPAPRQLRPEDAALIRSLVVYEDERLIALNKPAGLAVQGGSGTTRHVDGLLDALAAKGERPQARAPARPRHLGAAGGGAVRGGRARAVLRLPAAQGAQALLGHPAQGPRAQPGPDRPAARPRPGRPARRRCATSTTRTTRTARAATPAPGSWCWRAPARSRPGRR